MTGNVDVDEDHDDDDEDHNDDDEDHNDAPAPQDDHKDDPQDDHEDVPQGAPKDDHQAALMSSKKPSGARKPAISAAAEVVIPLPTKNHAVSPRYAQCGHCRLLQQWGGRLCQGGGAREWRAPPPAPTTLPLLRTG